jgi:hypothetical protein
MIWKWLLTKVMMWAGSKKFRLVIAWSEPNKTAVSALHFADDDRAMNTSMRSHIDALDESYKN